MTNQTDQTEERTKTYYEIRIPATITVRVSPDELYPEDGQSIDDDLLAYTADLIESPSHLRDATSDTDLDYANIDVNEYQQTRRDTYWTPRQRVSDTRSVRVQYEHVKHPWGAVWQYVARFAELKPSPEKG